MKLKILIGLILVTILLSIASPAMALSLGASPTKVDFDVPSDGSTTIDLKIHYFEGDVKISLIDIPLRVEPDTISVDASENPVDIQLTVYGDESLGTQTYDGYIRLIAVSGGAATGGVQVIAKITNVDTILIEDIIPISDTTTSATMTPADVTAATTGLLDVIPTISTGTVDPVNATDDTAPEVPLPAPVSTDKGYSPSTIGIVSGIVILLVVLSVLFVRRRKVS